MERIHATNKLVRRVRTVTRQKVDDKPQGLWYGVDYAWLDWCVAESFASYKHLYRLELDTSRLLILSTVDEVRQFAAKYGGTPDWGLPLETVSRFLSTFTLIDWARVAEDYGGIEIS